MSHRDDGKRLRDMLKHAMEAVAHVEGKTKDDLPSNRLLELSLIRLVEVVGEAASRVSLETRRGHPAILWQEIIRMRNRIIHVYDLVDLNVLWDTVRNDLPPLIAELEKIVAEEEKNR